MDGAPIHWENEFRLFWKEEFYPEHFLDPNRSPALIDFLGEHLFWMAVGYIDKLGRGLGVAKFTVDEVVIEAGRIELPTFTSPTGLEVELKCLDGSVFEQAASIYSAKESLVKNYKIPDVARIALCLLRIAEHLHLRLKESRGDLMPFERENPAACLDDIYKWETSAAIEKLKLSNKQHSKGGKAKNENEFGEAKLVAIELAQDYWPTKTESFPKNTEAARQIIRVLNADLSAVGLKKPPTESTVKGWIEEYTPPSAKAKRGRPSKNK